jgi:tricarballylate dehydrogenase
MADEEIYRYDVVVVGCGIAGLSAALSARESGVRVAVLERATEAERGGNSRYSGAILRMASETEVAPDFEEHFARQAGYHLVPEMVAETAADYANWPAVIKTMPAADPEVISTFAADAPGAVAWLKEQGIRFGEASFFGLTKRTSPRIAVEGAGLALVETLAPRAAERGVDFHYETTSRSLITDDGRVTGLMASGKDNRSLRFQAKSVILACGGFQGNPEMVAHYLGPQGRYLRPVARGGYYDRGEGIRMALDIGAAPAGDYSDVHMQAIDPRSSITEPLVTIFVLGILVNRDGMRFTDEAPGPIDVHGENIIRAINRQPGGIAWCVLDGRIDQVKNWQRCVRSDQPPIEADSLDGLANTIGVPAAAFRRTVDAYNDACVDDDIDPYRVDGVSTKSLTPPKSNWARPILEPPFRSYPIIGSNTFTFGGLKVTPDAQVLNTSGELIPGLYAAGETVGIYYGVYCSATSVLRGTVFGRRAGLHAGRVSAI